MKTVKKGKQIKRMPDGLAQEMVQRGWKYCPKSDWREKVRDAKPIETKKKVTKKDLKKKQKSLKEEFGTHKLVHIRTRAQGKKDERK